MIKKYKQFNEGVLQHLTGPNKEELLDGLSKLEPYTMLMKSLDNNFLPGIKISIERGADFHDNNEKLFRIAVNHNEIGLVKFYLEHGANVHALEEYAICDAAENGYEELFDLLMEYGANIHINADYPLNVISAKGNKKMLYNVLKRYKFDNRALMGAAEYAHTNEHYDIEKILNSYKS